MPLHLLDARLWFPPVKEAMPDGLLAMGGDLSQQRLLLAYRKGIFPWYEGDVPLWWCPDPRFVLFPAEINISKSMQQLLKKMRLLFTINKAFEQVINCCQTAERHGQQGTWITNKVEDAFISLHHNGYAHSAEVWQNGQLAGGLYGIRLGNIFLAKACLVK